MPERTLIDIQVEWSNACEWTSSVNEEMQIQNTKRNASPLTSFGHPSLATNAWNEDFMQQMIWRKLKMLSQQVAEKWMPLMGYVQNVTVKHMFVIVC